jgi:hypothetical protein
MRATDQIACGRRDRNGHKKASPQTSAGLSPMDQILHYRDVRYVIGHEQSSSRQWVIYPADGPADGARRGSATGDGYRGSFKVAVFAAQLAIDQWLDGDAPVSAQERIGAALHADRRTRTMAADEGHVVTERQQLVVNAPQQRGAIAIGEIGSSD